MHFSTPSWLWLLWLLPLLAALSAVAAARRRAALERFAEARFVDWLLPDRSRARSLARGLLLFVAITALVAAMAGPRWGFAWEDVERRGVDVVVALDLSRSMLAEDVKPSRLTAAKRELTDLVGLLKGDRLGLVVFSGTAYTQVPLTLDYATFGFFVDQLGPDWVPVGGTDLGAAVDQAVDTFVAEDRSSKAVILITDGEDHGGTLREAADRAKAEGVHVFVVGIGKPEGVPVPDGVGGFIKDRGGKVVLSKLDEPALKELALTTGGSYVRSVGGVADLEKIYLDDIKGSLAARALSSSRQKRWEERFQWLVFPALLLLLVERLLGPRRRRGTARRPERASGTAATTATSAAAALALALLPATAHAGWFEADHLRDGWRAFDDDRFDDALKSWTAAQTATPGERTLDYNIGHAHYRLGDFEAAEQSFRAATMASDRDLAADAWFNVGNSLAQMGKYLDAIASYDACLEIHPDDEDALVNRDIARQRYEKLLEQAQNDQQEREENPPEEQPEEQEQDADAENQEPGEEGSDGEQQQEQEQQQGQGMSEQEQEPSGGDSDGKDSGEEERDDQDGGQDDGQAEDTPAPQGEEEQIGGAAAAAEIDRSEDPAEDDGTAKDGDVAHDTVEDPDADARPPHVIEGALSEDEAEALLRALATDQAMRRAERTEREAARGRRAAAKDW